MDKPTLTLHQAQDFIKCPRAYHLSTVLSQKELSSSLKFKLDVMDEVRNPGTSEDRIVKQTADVIREQFNLMNFTTADPRVEHPSFWISDGITVDGVDRFVYVYIGSSDPREKLSSILFKAYLAGFDKIGILCYHKPKIRKRQNESEADFLGRYINESNIEYLTYELSNDQKEVFHSTLQLPAQPRALTCDSVTGVFNCSYYEICWGKLSGMLDKYSFRDRD